MEDPIDDEGEVDGAEESLDGQESWLEGGEANVQADTPILKTTSRPGIRPTHHSMRPVYI